MKKGQKLRELSMPFAGKDCGRPTTKTQEELHGRWTRHHLRPRSRGGKTTTTNLVKLRERPHQAWHYLFGNMTPEEIMLFIGVHLAPEGYFDMIWLRKDDHEIKLMKSDLQVLMQQGLSRVNVPGFDESCRHVRRIYRRKRRRQLRLTRASTAHAA